MTSNLERIKQLKEAAANRATHCCGHAVNLKSNCTACAAKNKQLKSKKNKAKWKARWTNERLPDGAVFNVAYSSKSESWSGTLSIPGCPAFDSTQSGVFPLLSRLDSLYRAWLKSGATNAVPKADA